VNLGVNAGEAMPRGGRLRFQAANAEVDAAMARPHPGARAGPHIRIAVADNGTGIPPEILDRIFDPFFTTKGRGRGSGMGLTTVLGIVRSHRGILDVASEVNCGSEFRILLPAVAAAAVPPPPAFAPEPGLGHGEPVLVIDDEESVRVMAWALLGSCGYRPLLAADGLNGVAVYRQHAAEIEVVITDLDLTGMSGAEVVAALRAINPRVRIVVLHGRPETGNPGLPPEPGRLALLRKPMTGEDLLRSIQSVLNPAQEEKSAK